MATPRTPRPLHATPRTSRPTLGPRIADVCQRLYGHDLMPWQRTGVDIATELNADGSFVHPEVVLTVPRQAGKTTLETAYLVDGLEHHAGHTEVYFTQSGPAGRTWWRKLGRTLHRSPYATSYKQRHALGDEVLTWGPTSSTLAMLPPTESAGHGDTIDRAAADEIWRQKDYRLPQAILPAQITRPLRQTWWISTAGTPESVLLLDLLAKAWATVSDPDAPIALLEWGAYAPMDDDDTCPCGVDHPVMEPNRRATWRAAHPAIGHTVPIEAVQHAHDTMAGPEFERAFLNRWTGQREVRQLPLELWAPAQVEQSPLVVGAALWLAFDVSPTRAGASIAAAGRLEDGRLGVELVDYYASPLQVAGRVLELVAKHRPVKVMADAAGPAKTVIDLLADRLGDRLEALNGREYASSCAAFYDDLVAGMVKVTTAPELDAAAGGAVKRPLGDGWAWGRARSAGDISPLVAVTLAAQGARLHQPKRKPRVYAGTGVGAR